MNRKRKAELIGALVLTFLLSTIGIAYYGYTKVEAAVNETYKPLRYQSDKRSEKVNIKEAQPLSVLLIETNDNQVNTLSFFTLNTDTPSTHVVHVDKQALPLTNEHDTEQIVASVEEVMDVPVDYYLKADTHVFEKLVQSVHKVEVQNPEAFATDGYVFREGTITLTPKEAHAFTTFSSTNETAEMDKKKRQQQVLKSVLRQVGTIHHIPQYDDVLTIVKDHIETNVTFDEVRTIQKRYREARKDVTQHVVNTKSDARNVAPTLKKHLEL
ncbi:LCP family protein [Bacillus sp. CGMCC 1.16541]|uniref:LCP family glycopolymer transferase n=1 Tax=Bacillus sp. CGMCC 1.16541 TaxID=2185143 RepID=UPI000D7394CB|nr:LCP family protein [Bacillus sp. CGMCC 1.16541]